MHPLQKFISIARVFVQFAAVNCLRCFSFAFIRIFIGLNLYLRCDVRV